MSFLKKKTTKNPKGKNIEEKKNENININKYYKPNSSKLFLERK